MDKEALLEADQVEEEFGTRYISIPRAESSEAYRDIEDFISTVKDQQLQERLWQAISGQRPFRRFKDVIGYNPAEETRWFRFSEDRGRERMLEWLKDEGIKPV